MTDLAELFPEGDHRFQLTLRRTEPRAFFAPTDASGRVLAERARWLAAEPSRYVAGQPEGEAPWREFRAMLARDGGWPGPTPGAAGGGGSWMGEMSLAGAAVEPDFLFLTRDAEGRYRLRGGVLAFPTGWALEDKIGHTLESIHGVVPGLNPALGPTIQQFLAKLKPGVAFLRDNWGLA
ncbi:MAG: heme-dependent oxidative N-demethylase subunit alpha family protein, partial [Opitutaceae bacterium]